MSLCIGGHCISCVEDGSRTQRSRVGTLTDKAVKTAKRRAAEATLGKVEIDNNVLDNVYSFEYLGSRLQGDGDDEADVRYRMRKRHSRHCPTYGRIIAFRAIGSLGFIICAYAPH